MLLASYAGQIEKSSPSKYIDVLYPFMVTTRLSLWAAVVVNMIGADEVMCLQNVASLGCGVQEATTAPSKTNCAFNT